MQFSGLCYKNAGLKINCRAGMLKAGEQMKNSCAEHKAARLADRGDGIM